MEWLWEMVVRWLENVFWGFRISSQFVLTTFEVIVCSVQQFVTRIALSREVSNIKDICHLAVRRGGMSGFVQ